jgi:hypothetical protein
VPRSLQYLEAHFSEFDSRAVGERCERIARLGRGSQVDCRAHAVAQFQMPGDEISMKVGQEYVLDLERVFGGKCHVLVGVALRVNDCRRA